MPKERTDQEYAERAAELMGWEVWVEQDTTGRRDKYYCSKEKDFIMWVKDWKPLTDANRHKEGALLACIVLSVGEAEADARHCLGIATPDGPVMKCE